MIFRSSFLCWATNHFQQPLVLVLRRRRWALLRSSRPQGCRSVGVVQPIHRAVRGTSRGRGRYVELPACPICVRPAHTPHQLTTPIHELSLFRVFSGRFATRTTYAPYLKDVIVVFFCSSFWYIYHLFSQYVHALAVFFPYPLPAACVAHTLAVTITYMTYSKYLSPPSAFLDYRYTLCVLLVYFLPVFRLGLSFSII